MIRRLPRTHTVSFISRERWDAGPKPCDDERGFTCIVPDLAIEIVSPSSVRRDRIEKRIACARAGVSEYWIVDPERREIAIHATLGDRFAEPRVATTGPVESHVLPEPRLTVGQILAPPR